MYINFSNDCTNTDRHYRPYRRKNYNAHPSGSEMNYEQSEIPRHAVFKTNADENERKEDENIEEKQLRRSEKGIPKPLNR